MHEAVVVAAIRTPIGKRGGDLSGIHPADLLADLIAAVFTRTKVDPGSVDDVVVGCMEQVGEQSNTIGRMAWLTAGFPEHVPAVTVERQCSSSQQALHSAVHAIEAGADETVLVAGVESMSRVPIGVSTTGPGSWLTDRMRIRYSDDDRFGGAAVTQFDSADLIAERWGVGRPELERYSLRSHQRAAAAADSGQFDREIEPVTVGSGLERTEVTQDQGIRRDTSLERMAGLRPVRDGGLNTAATSSQVSDGAAAVLLMARRRAEREGIQPRARFVATSVVGHNYIEGLTAPIPATRRVLDRAGLHLQDMAAVEINEAFASVVLAWQRELMAPQEWFDACVNPRGGAIAIGHPIGCSGVRLFTTLLHELEDSGGRYGLQTMCASHGLATATIIERLEG